jgi:hypothetical protein
MIRHVGASVLLSGAILVLAAVVLYRAEVPSGSQGWVEGPVEAVPEAVEAKAPKPADAAPVETPIREEPEAPALVEEDQAEPAVVRRPEAPFTLCEPGETLRDVARRIYGSAGMAEPLREVNRDLVGRIDEPVKPGLALRTPPLDRQEPPEVASALFEEAP